MGSAKVLIADKIDEASVKRLSIAGLDVTVKTGMAPQDLLKEIPPYDAVVVRGATKLTASAIEAAKKLRLIVRAGVGLDNIDLASAESKGIEVRNVPGATSISVAELTMGLMLALARHIPQANLSMHQGRWEKKSFSGTELSGKTLGLIGLGKIGSQVARRAHAFGMRILTHDPYITAETASAIDVQLSPFDQLLAQSDFISIHVPLTEETRNFVDANAISKMKPGARLINCSRGGIVDEEAVARALKQGHLAGAAFDVFANEPLGDSPLKDLPNCILIPHLGAQTNEGQGRASREAADIVIEFFKEA